MVGGVGFPPHAPAPAATTTATTIDPESSANPANLRIPLSYASAGARSRLQRRRIPREFAAALYRKKQTLTWLQRRLADSGTTVSMTTLSYWRSGI